MAWQGIKTWAAGPWTFSDANAYIRDDMQSIRRYQVGTRQFSDNGSLTTSLTTFASHLTLCPSTPDENTKLIVIAFGNVSVTNANVAVNIGIRDQAGTSIGFVGPTGSFFATTGANYPFMMMGGNTVSAGTNPGFDLRMSVSAGTGTFFVGTCALVVPIV